MRDKPYTSTFETLLPEQMKRSLASHLISGQYVKPEILQWHVQVYARASQQAYNLACESIASLARQTLENRLAQLKG